MLQPPTGVKRFMQGVEEAAAARHLEARLERAAAVSMAAQQVSAPRVYAPCRGSDPYLGLWGNQDTQALREDWREWVSLQTTG